MSNTKTSTFSWLLLLCTSIMHASATQSPDCSSSPLREQAYYFQETVSSDSPFLLVHDNVESFEKQWPLIQSENKNVGLIVANLDDSTKRFKAALTYDGEPVDSGWWGLFIQASSGDGWVRLEPGQIAVAGSFKDSVHPNSGNVRFNAALRTQYYDKSTHKWVGEEYYANLVEWSVENVTNILKYDHSLGKFPFAITIDVSAN
jgi:hypothetical protein